MKRFLRSSLTGWLRVFCAVFALTGACSLARAVERLDVRNFGVVPNSRFDASIGLAAALRAAEQYNAARPDDRVEIRLPAGRYELRRGLTVPSRVSIIGDAGGETIISFNPPPQSWGQVAFTTRNPPPGLHYLPIARADDPRHPPVPGGSYRGHDFIYLHDKSDIAVLRGLGVPEQPGAIYSGLKATVASGATLGNNRGTRLSFGAPVREQMMREPGINPTPAQVMTIAAVDESGRVTLAQHSRFDWGRDYHDANETLDEYYAPEQFAVTEAGTRVPKTQCPACKTWAQKAFTSGPAWIIPMDAYTYDIAFENLIFEQDFNRPAANLQQTYILFLMYVDRAVVRNCKFRNIGSIYPILSVRGFNIDIADSEFALSMHAAVTLDAGSGYTIRGSRFIVDLIADATQRGFPSTPAHFIGYDESPIEVTIAGNTFVGLQKEREGNAGAAIFGTGGAHTRLLDNNFADMEGPILLNVIYNDHAVVSGNRLRASSPALYTGTGAAHAAVSHNIYSGGGPSKGFPFPKGAASFDSYNRTELPNFACANRGVSVKQAYRATTRFPGNVDISGAPVHDSIVVQPVPGAPSLVRSSASLNDERLISVALAAGGSLRRGAEADVVVTLNRAAKSDFPFSLEITSGDVTTAVAAGGTFIVPAGSDSVRVPRGLRTYHAGEFMLAARSLCTTSIERAELKLRISD